MNIFQADSNIRIADSRILSSIQFDYDAAKIESSQIHLDELFMFRHPL